MKGGVSLKLCYHLGIAFTSAASEEGTIVNTGRGMFTGRPHEEWGLGTYSPYFKTELPSDLALTRIP